MDSEYREPTWRGVLLTLAATILVIAGVVFLTSWLLQENCAPVAAQVSCAEGTPLPEPGTE